MSHKNQYRTNANIPPIGSKSPPSHHGHHNFHTIKHSPKHPPILNQQPPRSFVSMKQNPSDLGAPIVKPISTKKKTKSSNNNNNEAEINNCISNMDNIFKDVSDYLQSPEFQEIYGSIPIPPNLISDE